MQKSINLSSGQLWFAEKERVAGVFVADFLPLQL